MIRADGEAAASAERNVSAAASISTPATEG